MGGNGKIEIVDACLPDEKKEDADEKYGCRETLQYYNVRDGAAELRFAEKNEEFKVHMLKGHMSSA